MASGTIKRPTGASEGWPAANFAAYRRGWMLVALAVAAWLSPVINLGESTWRCHSRWYDTWKTMGVVQAWEAGILDARWFPGFDQGYGYPSLSYHAPGFYWVSGAIMAAFRHAASDALAVSIGVRLALAFFLAIGLTGMLAAGEWFWTRASRGRLTPLFPGLVCALGWWMAPWPAVNVYVRGSGAEFAAYQFMPWIFAFGARFLLDGASLDRRSLRWPLLAAMALACAIQTHNHAGIVLCGFAAALPLIMTPVAWALGAPNAGKRAAAWLAIVAPAALALSLWFWLPALVEAEWAMMERSMLGYLGPSQHALEWSNLARLAYWDAGISRPGPDDTMSFHLGFVSALALFSASAAAIGCAIRRRFGAEGFAVAGLFVATTIGLLLTTRVGAPLWDNFELLRRGQFPWRLLMLPSFGVAMLLPAFAAWNAPERNASIRPLLLNGLLLVGLMSYFCYFRIAEEEQFTSDNDYELWHAWRIIANDDDEFRPRWSAERPAAPSIADQLLPAEGVTAAWIEATPERPREIEARNYTGAPATLALARNYTPAWRATDERGEVYALSPQAATGFIEVAVPPGEHRFSLRYANTPVRIWGKTFSILCWIASLALVAGWPWRRGSGAAAAARE